MEPKGSQMEPKGIQKLVRNRFQKWSRKEPDMRPIWSPISTKAGLSHLVIFFMFAKLGQEVAKMGPEGYQDRPEQVKIGLI